MNSKIKLYQELDKITKKMLKELFLITTLVK